MMPPSRRRSAGRRRTTGRSAAGCGTIQPRSSGSQRLTTSPLYFTPAWPRGRRRAWGRRSATVEKAVWPCSAFLSVPRMSVSPTATSATWPLRTSALNSLYGICRPPGARNSAWPRASSSRTPRNHQSAVGRGAAERCPSTGRIWRAGQPETPAGGRCAHRSDHSRSGFLQLQLAGAAQARTTVRTFEKTSRSPSASTTTRSPSANSPSSTRSARGSSTRR